MRTLLCAGLLTIGALGQDLNHVPAGPAKDPTLHVDSALLHLEAAVRGGADPAAEAARRNLLARDDGRVLVEVITRGGGARVTDAALRQRGAEPTHGVQDRVNAWVAADRIEALARALPGTRLAEASADPDHLGEPGDELQGADTYIAGGADGSGIGVAIIDTTFADLNQYAANGWVPGGWIERDFHPSRNFHDHDGGGVHGTFCYQSAAQSAPGATFYLYLFDSTTTTTTAVFNHIAADPNIHVVSYSFADHNEGWGDNSGNSNAGIAQITAAGKLFFAAGGNYAEQHWQGSFSDGDGDSWHQFAGADELNSMTLQPGEGLTISLMWDQSSGTPDYDLFLYDSNINELDRSDDDSDGDVGDFERIGWTNGSANAVSVGIAIRHVDGPAAQFEFFADGSVSNDTLQYQVPEGSTTSPVNSLQANCISVAAVDDDFYGDASAPATNYSSWGPTNGGATRPDLTGPTGTLAGGSGSFIGTSAACPNVAGAAAALWSSAGYLDANGLRQLLVRQAMIYKDWGAPGKDNVYGRGGVFLAPYAWGTRWVDRLFGDPSGVSYRPYFYVKDACDAAPSGGRLMILGGTYPENITLDKNLRVQTALPLVTLGD